MKEKAETWILTALFTLLAALLLILAVNGKQKAEQRGMVELPQNTSVLVMESILR